MGTSISINIYYTWFVLKKKLVPLSEVFGRKSTTFICRINSNNQFGFKNNVIFFEFRKQCVEY